MNEITHDPLVPADVDLRDFAFMPLDVVRLRDSDLAAMESPEACWAAVLLWCASWHQVPAASLPNDDRVLANLAGFGRVVKEWKRVREGALRGWVACRDGRLYHPVVAEKAKEAWRSKLEQRHRTECARIKKHNQRNSAAIPIPDFDEWMSLGCPQGQSLPVPKDTPTESRGTHHVRHSVVPGEMASKGQGEGQGQGQGSIKDTRARAPDHGLSASSSLPSGAIEAFGAMRAVGIADGHAGHPDLLALVAAGATRAEFESAGIVAVGKGKGFRYAIGTLKGQRKEAAAALGQMHHGAMPDHETPRQTAAINRVIEMTGGMLNARRQAQKPEFIDAERSDLTALG